MKVKELIGLLQKVDPEEIIYGGHGEITDVCYLIYTDYPSELCLLDKETYDDMVEHDWPTMKEVK